MKPKSRDLIKKFTLDPVRDKKGNLSKTFYSPAEKYSQFQNPEKRKLSNRAKELFESLKQQNLPTMALTGNTDWLYENKGKHWRIDERVKRKIRDLMKLKDSPENLAKPLNVRAKSWRKFLEKLSPEERKKAIEQRKQIAAKRKPVWKELNNAFSEIQKEFPWLRGFIIFGSFARGKEKFEDLDLLPIIDQEFDINDKFRTLTQLRDIEGKILYKLQKKMPNIKLQIMPVPNQREFFVDAIKFATKQHSGKYLDFVGEPQIRKKVYELIEKISKEKMQK